MMRERVARWFCNKQQELADDGVTIGRKFMKSTQLPVFCYQIILFTFKKTNKKHVSFATRSAFTRRYLIYGGTERREIGGRVNPMQIFLPAMRLLNFLLK